MNSTQIRAALRAGERIYASCMVGHSPMWPNAVAATGIDFVFIDSEHIPADRENLSWMCRAFDGVGLPPVIRIPEPDAFEAAKILDGGAAGFIAPYIETVEQVEELTAVARYRPLKGRRVEQAVREPESLEPGLKSYLDARNGRTLFIANIESVPAIENLDELLAVGGIDSVLIGPHDLSCSLGVPEQYDHPRFDEAVRSIFSTARRHHVGAGIHFWTDIDQEIEWARTAGANLIMHSADLTLFSQALKADIAQIRSALGETQEVTEQREDIV